MPERAGILGLGAYTPSRIMTNQEWEQWVDTTDAWITERTGIKRRRIAADDETTASMAVNAARRALGDAGLEVEEIDEIIVATDTPEVFLPDTAAFVQHRLGARQIPAYDLAGSGCAGFVQALDVARSRLSPQRRHVLVIGVELLTRLMNWKDRSTCVLFGDAAGAAVVGARADAAEILAATAGTDGSRAGILTLEAGGTKVPFTRKTAAAGLHRAVVMEGREVYREAVSRMTSASLEVLKMANRALEEVDLVVPHQANLRIIQAVEKALGLSADKTFSNIRDYGNTGSASVPLALTQARQQGRINPGDLVLLTAFGSGFHWAAALIRF